MKAIVLAAGQGVRLRPITDDRPKCMVKFKGNVIIDYILKALSQKNINDVVVVNGYKKKILEDHLRDYDIKFITNENYNATNMVATFFTAEEQMNDDLIISYADIIYSPEIIEKLVESPFDFAIVVDKNWKELWALRMEDPLADAETMRIDEDGFVYELGKTPSSYEEIQGQYVGLIKISKDFLPYVIQHYKNLNKTIMYDGKSFDNMFMTSFIQSLINSGKKPKAVFIEGGWIEIDTLDDLNKYQDVDFDFV